MYESPKTGSLEIKGAYKGSTPARRCYVGGTLVYQGFGPASEQEFIQQEAPGGPAQLLKVYGKTIVNNQLVKNGDFSAGTTGWESAAASATMSVTNGVMTIAKAISSAGGIVIMDNPFQAFAAHKYYISVYAKSNSAGVAVGLGFHDSVVYLIAGNTILLTSSLTYEHLSGIVSPVNNSDILAMRVGYASSAMGVSGSFKDIRCIDLTDLYGAGNEPTSVAQFEADYPNFDPAYNPGSLQSNKTTELRAERIPVINVWDEEWENGAISSSNGNNVPSSTDIRSKNLIPLNAGSTYYFKAPIGVNLRYYDANKAFLSSYNAVINPGSSFTTPSGAAYVRFWGAGTTYNNDICINLSDPAINGTYFPHWRGSLSLNLSTLTGKLNGEGASVVVYPDGLRGVGTDRDAAYGSTGEVRLGKRAYQAGDESDTLVLTDGTNTIYPLATPLTYTLDTPLPTDLTCEQGDILQRVSDNNCPFVGEMKFGL